MSTNIRPGPREVMELQRRCLEECQPYFDLIAKAVYLDTRVVWIFRNDGTLDRMLRDTSETKYLYAVIDGIIKRYTALALGEDTARNAAKPTNL